MRTRLAWTLFALTCAFVVVQVTLLASSSGALLSTRHLSDGFPLVTLAAVAGAGIGALIVSQHPRHRVGWLLVVGQCGTAFGLAAQAYGRDALAGELGSAPGGQLAVWLSFQTGAIFAITVLAALFLIAPDGRLLSPRWSWAMGVSLLGLVLYWAAVASVRPSGIDRNGLAVEDPAVLVDVLEVSGAVAVLVGLVAGTVSLVKRLGRASGEERHQLRWMAAAAAALAAGALVAVVSSLFGAPPWLCGLPVMVGYLCVPIFTGVAILRFHLYEIDLIVSRAIVLTVLSGLLAAGYVAAVVVIGEIVGAPAGGTFWPSLMATALVAISVQPLRRRVAQMADRVAYGARAAPYEELADFSRGLHESRETVVLLPRVAEAVGRAVAARDTEIWIDVPGNEAPRAYWPDGEDREDRDPDLVLPVRDGGDILGGLSVTMPPGRPLRPSEERLLYDFTVQLGRAFRNIRLESELADRVDELAAQAAELSASSSRLLSAQAAGRHRFESAIGREVLPHLAGLPAELAAIGYTGSHGDRLEPEAINAMVARTNRALEALRTLTRGVFPAQLAHRGLVPALSSQLARTGLAGILRTDESVVARRFDPRVESAAYFCGVEFLRELDPAEELTLTLCNGTLQLTVTGHGTATVTTGTRHLADRVAALGGTVRIEVIAALATLCVDIPLPSDQGLVPDLQQAVGVER